LYQAMDLNMPKKVEEMTEDEGYHALSLESVPEYAGDYLILSQDGESEDLEESDVLKNIPAVKNNQVLQVDMDRFYFNDATTLNEILLSLFSKNSTESATIIHDIRLPREIGAVFVGAALAVSGAIMQALTRNPLAEPGLLGLSAGASAMLAISFALFPSLSY